MSEEMSQAMECRGFTGEYTTNVNLNIRKADYVYIIVNLIFVGTFLLTYI
jgi:cobalt/nickel transport system permease protein